jgi:cysteine desulfurase
MADSINLDHNATTPTLPEAWEAMRPYLTSSLGNPSSAHSLGRKARQVLEEARERIAKRLGADADEVVFTSGATEANNLAIFGLARERIASSNIEHPCVVEPLASCGLERDSLPVNTDGTVNIDNVSAHVRLLVLMRVNHETGAIQPIPRHSFWHCDAAQAAGKVPINCHELGAATLTISGHKFGAPPGIGALLIRKGVKLKPLIFGGHQQQGRRPGTEPVALAVGMAAALDAACDNMDANYALVTMLRSQLLARLQTDAAPIAVNSPGNGSPYVLNVSFSGLRADALLMALDIAGVACSTGSACSSGSLLPSPVLQAMGVPDDVLRSAMRFSFSPSQRPDEIDNAANRIIMAVQHLRDQK